MGVREDEFQQMAEELRAAALRECHTVLLAFRERGAAGDRTTPHHQTPSLPPVCTGRKTVTNIRLYNGRGKGTVYRTFFNVCEIIR